MIRGLPDTCTVESKTGVGGDMRPAFAAGVTCPCRYTAKRMTRQSQREQIVEIDGVITFAAPRRSMTETVVLGTLGQEVTLTDGSRITLSDGSKYSVYGVRHSRDNRGIAMAVHAELTAGRI